MLSLTHDLWYEAGSTIWAQAGTLRAAAHWLSATAAEINGVVALEAPRTSASFSIVCLSVNAGKLSRDTFLEASPLCHERLRFDNRRVHGDRRERTHSNAWWNGTGRTKVGNDHLVAICDIVGLWRHQTIRATSRHIIHGVTIEVATQTRNALVEEVARQIDVHVVVLLGRVIDHNFDGRSVEKVTCTFACWQTQFGCCLRGVWPAVAARVWEFRSPTGRKRRREWIFESAQPTRC